MSYIMPLLSPNSLSKSFLPANTGLGAIEQFASARHHLGFYHNVGISASYNHSSRDSPRLKAAIFSALAVVINRHSILSAIPVDEDSAHPYFARLPSLNLEEAVTFLTRSAPIQEAGADEEHDALLQQQHNISYKARYGELPFWRLIILMNETPSEISGSNFTASFIFHHALGDGASGMLFHKHFYAALVSDGPFLTITSISTPHAPLSPNLELLHPACVPAVSPAPNLEGLWSGSRISMPEKSNFKSLTIPAFITTTFLTACRAHQTTVTASIPVIIASALSSLLPNQYTNFEVSIPVDLRRFLPDSITKKEPFGVFIDAISQYYTRSALSSGSLWDEARRSKATLNSYLQTADTHINVARLGKVSDMRNFFLTKVGEDRGSSFNISNLGGMGPLESDSMERGVQNGWKMGRMVFSRSAFVSGSALSTSLVTGPDGAMVFGFVWQEGVIERWLIEGVVQYVKREIERIARGG